MTDNSTATARSPIASALTLNLHPGDKPDVRVEESGETTWLTVYNEAGEEMVTFFLNPPLIAALRTALNSPLLARCEGRTA